MRARILLVLAIVVHLGLQLAPAWRANQADRSGRDFASYYYAFSVAKDGGDPYDTALLSRAAAREGTRNRVHPFFYPPPFLLTMGWTAPLSMKAAYAGMVFLNEALLAATLWLMVRRFSVPIWAVALLLCTYTPIPDNATMGQANLLALVPMLAGLALAPTAPWIGGALVGAAGMLKMSPALFLGYWLLRRQWKPVVAAAVTAVALSLVTLPLVGFSDQLPFYTDILPGFSRGDYHGLTVPISLEANHSIPDLYDRLFPTPANTLSPTALRASTGTILALLAAWAWWFRKPGNEPAAIGALTVLMVVTPVYTYEHHLVFLLMAIGAAAELSVPFFAVYVLLAMPLFALHWLKVQAPDALGSWVRELKTIGELGLIVLLARRAARRGAGAGPGESPGAAPVASAAGGP